MAIQSIISFFESHGFKHIPAELRKLKKKDTTDHHKVKQFLLKLIRRPAFILPRDYQHIKSEDIYTLPEKLQQYMNITLNYANRWVNCCMVIFHSNNPSGIEQNYDGFMTYSTFVEENIDASSVSF